MEHYSDIYTVDFIDIPPPPTMRELFYFRTPGEMADNAAGFVPLPPAKPTVKEREPMKFPAGEFPRSAMR